MSAARGTLTAHRSPLTAHRSPLTAHRGGRKLVCGHSTEKGMCRVCVCVALAWLAGASALGTPYWVSWNATMGYPEANGWSRNWGNWQGQYQGPGAYRSISGGTLTYDSRYDSGVFDISELERAMDPGPGETFVLEWRVFVEEDYSYHGDAGIGFGSDRAMLLGFKIRPGEIRSGFENGVTLQIAPGVFHEYRVTSTDMLTYRLYIDGELGRVGSFWQGVTESYIAWGDGTQDFVGGALHHWDYLRFGVVPEPSALALTGAVIACLGGAGLRRKVTWAGSAH